MDEIKSYCPKCKNLGWISTKRGVIKCSCKLGNINENIYQRMKIPPRYRHVSLDNFQIMKKYNHHHILKEVKEYIYSKDYKFGRGLFFLGKPGIGKTHLAVSILKEFYKKRGIVGLFYDTNNLLFDLRSTFDGSVSTRELLDEVITTPVLVLDDLGSERLSDWAKDILHYVITTRYNELRPIIITSNISIKAENLDEDVIEESLEERLGKSIASRLTEMCKIIEMDGKDMRNTTIVRRMLEDAVENSNS